MRQLATNLLIHMLNMTSWLYFWTWFFWSGVYIDIYSSTVEQNREGYLARVQTKLWEWGRVHPRKDWIVGYCCWNLGRLSLLWMPVSHGFYPNKMHMRISFSYQVESSQSVEPLRLISGSHGFSADPKERRQIIPWNKEILLAFLRFFLGTAAGNPYPFRMVCCSWLCAETIAFHGGIVLSCYIIMGITKPILTHRSNIHKELRWAPLMLWHAKLSYSAVFRWFLWAYFTPLSRSFSFSYSSPSGCQHPVYLPLGLRMPYRLGWIIYGHATAISLLISSNYLMMIT